MNNPEINFYQTDKSPLHSMAKIIIKALDDAKKLLIFCQNDAEIKNIDNFLWQFNPNKFIPHSTIKDKHLNPKRQPILITNEEENTNQADYLIFFDEPSKDFLNQFTRIFYFFTNKDSQTADNLKLKLNPQNFYKKENGKWKKLAI